MAGSVLRVLWSAIVLAVVLTTSVVYGDECDINNPSGQFSYSQVVYRFLVCYPHPFQEKRRLVIINCACSAVCSNGFALVSF